VRAPPADGFGIPACSFAGFLFDVLIEPAGACPAAKWELAELGQEGIKQAPRMRPPDVVSSATGTVQHATGSKDPFSLLSHCNNNEGDVIGDSVTARGSGAWSVSRGGRNTACAMQPW